MNEDNKVEREIFINLMTDFGFKRLFGSVEFKPILIRFLNILFENEGLFVNDVEFHDKEVLPPDPDGKRIVYDVYCTSVRDGKKDHFVVEMQQVYHVNFEKRVMFYIARALAMQGKKGDTYDFEPVYGIFLTNFNFKHLHKKLLQDFRMMETDTHQVFSNILRLMIVSLEEVKESYDDCTTKLEKITYIIKNMHKMDKESKAYLSGEFDEFFEASDLGHMAAEDIVTYGESKRKLKDLQLSLDWAIKEGLAQGLEQGLEKGRAEERAVGIRIMYEMGVPVKVIAEKYGMPESSVLKTLKL